MARIEALLDLGIEKFAVTGPNFAAPSPPAREAAERFTEDVAKSRELPRLRR